MSTAAPPPAPPADLLPPAPGLAGRAVVAIALLIGFYVLALGLAALLLYLLYLDLSAASHINVRLVIYCLVGTGLIV